MKKFTKEVLDEMLEDIIIEYFKDESVTLSLWETIEHVKEKYREEISTL